MSKAQLVFRYEISYLFRYEISDLFQDVPCFPSVGSHVICEYGVWNSFFISHLHNLFFPLHHNFTPLQPHPHTLTPSQSHPHTLTSSQLHTLTLTATCGGQPLVSVVTKVLSGNHGNETKLAAAQWWVLILITSQHCSMYGGCGWTVVELSPTPF